METARIAALLEPFLDRPLAPSQLDRISIYIDLLQRWNARINLTAIRNEEEIVTRHFGESLFLARHLFPSEAPASDSLPAPEGSPSPLRLGENVGVLDIGSGAGFPAIPLKIWAPSIRLTMIESNHKKAAFLNEVARALTFAGINVIVDRADAVAAGPHPPKADIVTLRAVERFESILPEAVSFLAPNGILALLITTSQTSSLTTHTQLKWTTPIHIPKSQTRIVSMGRIDKVE
ncbi:MAG: 16S rRNA (guanine(527)-N(7))-methyltransferase RsmG [Terriglobales bacterium]